MTRGAFDLAQRASVDATFDSDGLEWLSHGGYAFKGVAEPVGLFQVLSDGPAAEDAALADFGAAMEAYRGQRWELAVSLFSKVLDRDADDRTSDIMIRRCQQLAQNPPADWDGVWRI